MNDSDKDAIKRGTFPEVVRHSGEMRQTAPCLSTNSDSVATPTLSADLPSEPKLCNRGDGVVGHYCIGRLMRRGEPYMEYWNNGVWCSAGEVFRDEYRALVQLGLIRAGIELERLRATQTESSVVDSSEAPTKELSADPESHEVNTSAFADVWLELLVWANGGEMTINYDTVRAHSRLAGTKIVTRHVNTNGSVTLRLSDCPIHNAQQPTHQPELENEK